MIYVIDNRALHIISMSKYNYYDYTTLPGIKYNTNMHSSSTVI